MSSAKTGLPNWAETVAVFGGAFDPPHLGHRVAVRGLFSRPGVKKVLLMPAANPPFKKPNCNASQRLKMVELNFMSVPGDSFSLDIEIEPLELKKAETHPNEPSYSFYSLSELRRSHPKLAFVIGTDQLEQLKNWHRFPELIHLCSWIVLERQPMGHEVSQKTLQTWAASGLITPVSAGNGTSQWEIRGQDGRSGKAIITVPTEAPELSSTNIRENMAKGTPIDELGLFPPVAAYLKENRLYGIYQGS